MRGGDLGGDLPAGEGAGVLGGGATMGVGAHSSATSATTSATSASPLFICCKKRATTSSRQKTEMPLWRNLITMEPT